MTKNLIAPSILSGDFACMGNSVKEIAEYGLDWAHSDVMDGVYVPNISFGMPMVKAIRKSSDIFIDAHLMIVEPEKYAERFIDAGADTVTFHPEASKDALSLLKRIRERGKLAGLALNPDIPLSVLEPFYSYFDIIIIMGVFPGYSGQKLIPDTLNKVKALSEEREKRGLSFLIEFDGGVTLDNAATIKSIGADVLVAGSSFFDAKDKAVAARRLKELNE